MQNSLKSHLSLEELLPGKGGFRKRLILLRLLSSSLTKQRLGIASRKSQRQKESRFLGQTLFGLILVSLAIRWPRTNTVLRQLPTSIPFYVQKALKEWLKDRFKASELLPTRCVHLLSRSQSSNQTATSSPTKPPLYVCFCRRWIPRLRAQSSNIRIHVDLFSASHNSCSPPYNHLGLGKA